MSDKERVIQLLDKVPDYKIGYVLAYGQGITADKLKKVLMLVDGENLISFCTFADKDDIQPTELTPWIGWVYTFPHYRGHRYVGKLLSYAEALAKTDGINSIYISTNHNGLYEKYGYEFFEIMKDIHGEDSRVYVRHL